MREVISRAILSKPATANTITGGGTIQDTADTAVAGAYRTSKAVTYTVGLNYNKSLTNLQGQIKLTIPQDDGTTILVKSNSLSSMSITNVSGGKQATVFAKASVSRINADNSVTAIEGGVTLRMDVRDMNVNSGDAIGFTVLSKTSEMLYTNDWFYDVATKTWKTRAQALAGGTIQIG